MQVIIENKSTSFGDDDPPEGLVGYCDYCKGPVYAWDQKQQGVDGDGVVLVWHRFSTWCNHFIELRKKFLNSCGITAE